MTVRTTNTAAARRMFRSLTALALACVAATATAQPYPAKPIRLIVPFPPGGGNDIVSRTVNIRLPALLGQQVVIDNRPGAGGNIGTELAAKAPGDGYTLLIANNSLTANYSLYRKLPYDPFKDFVPVAMGATSPNMIVTHPSLPVRTVKELIALAKSRPGQLTYGSPGPGTGSHLAGELFRARCGVDIVHVPYKGAGPVMVDQIAGHVVLSFTAPLVSKPFIDSGKLRAIAVTSEQRWPGYAQVPAVAEAGFPGFHVVSWFAYFAPAGTPRPIVERLAADIGKALQAPEIRERFSGQGIEAGNLLLDALGEFVRKDWETVDKLIKSQGLKLD